MGQGGLWARLRRRLGGRALIEAEAEAQAARDRLREALDVLPEGIVFLDADGRYIMWNKRYAEIYHRSADLFAPGRKLADTLRIGVERGDYPDAVGREEEWLADRMARLETAVGERHEQKIADGRWLMIEERRTADGGVIGLRVDITHMKEQAAALEQALAHVEAASRAKNEFLADMSHELRTPLNGVMGLAEALTRTELDHNQAALVEDILGSAGKLSRIVSGLLDYGEMELAPSPAQGLHPSSPPADGKVRILLADDNPTNRKVVELMLGATDAEVTSVENGALAIDAWAANRFDLVLMDLRMPVLDGLGAIRAIRAQEAEKGPERIPIIVLSANTSPEDREASASAGADDHIGKPIRADELFGAIGAALG